ncbi:hypothetical protein [Acidianus bottle-shaped virus]|uniref:Uncharacterized protein ORF243 n=1 Tax=Acidianus bottle-shaped virus (isolate Italy/Pozzuoli) TaxID=654911 RepID=Y243_ABVP|nr:hypothetical protein ABV_gp04 [Acidianus bottle-shaped virus]A4ZU90.1 RecName: Full=Uncharacterized protein ORF243 [Acidianus bottle-shaped virus (isolate Pozzuoli)]ABP73394.1 hypothetical protein [Acidianus bottle-shaped virus]
METKFSDVINGLKEWYDEYLKLYPEYKNFLTLLEIVSEEGPDKAIDNEEFNKLVINAVTKQPKIYKIYLTSDDGIYPLPTWNSDVYVEHFEQYYIDRIVFSRKYRHNRDFLIGLTEYYGSLVGLTKIAIDAVVSDYVREQLGIYHMSLDKALQLNLSIPINTLLDRIRNNYKVPIIKEMDEENPVVPEERPKSNNEPTYRQMINEYQEKAPVEIKLTPEEIEEEITRRILDETIEDEYDEIES